MTEITIDAPYDVDYDSPNDHWTEDVLEMNEDDGITDLMTE